ncbi:hypothetical protein Emed_004405 [Eimeria media]
MSLPNPSPFPEESGGVANILEALSSPATPEVASSLRVVAPLQRRSASLSPKVFHHVAGLIAAAAVVFLIGLCVRKLVRGKGEGLVRRLATGGGDTCGGGDSDGDDEAGPSPQTQARNAQTESVMMLKGYCTVLDELLEGLAQETHDNLAVTPTGRMGNQLVRALQQQIEIDEQATNLHNAFLSVQERTQWEQVIEQAREKAAFVRDVLGLGWYDSQPPQPMPENIRLLLHAQKNLLLLREKFEFFVRGYPERSEERKGALLEAKDAAFAAVEEMRLNQHILSLQTLVNNKAQEKRQMLELALKDVDTVLKCYAIQLPGGGHFPGTDKLLIRAVNAFTDTIPIVLRMYYDPGNAVDINVMASWGLKYKGLFNELRRRVHALNTRPQSMLLADQAPAREAVDRARLVVASVQAVIDEDGTVVD